MARDPIDAVVKQMIAEARPWQFASVRVDIPDTAKIDASDFAHLFTWHIASQLSRKP